jgi:glycosyltransferase involved in cell wall biosynthesis
LSGGSNACRIFLVGTEFFQTGGIQYVNRLLVKAFEEMRRATPLALEVFAYGDSPAAVAAHAGGRGATRWHAFSRKRAAMAWGLAQRARAAQPHVVLFTHVNLMRLSRLVRAAAPRAKVAALGHGVEVWEPVAPRIRRMLQRADAVLSPSAYTRAKLIAENSVEPGRITVIAHGLDPSWTTGRTQAAPKRPYPTLLSVARLTHADVYKGLSQVLQAMPHVLERCPGARYVVVGDGDARASLERLAQQLGVWRSAEFCGELQEDDLRRAYQAADLFVLPSKKEGFGIVFLEAMSHGLPVVAARVGGTLDVVEDGRSGILVPPDSPEQLASALSGLLLLREERARMGAAGRRRVEENFLFPHFTARWQRWLAALVPEAVYLARHAAVASGSVALQGS